MWVMGPVAGEQGELGPAELGSLYETYWPSLVRTAWMMTGSRAEAEDIVHDAFVRLASGRHQVPEHPLSYLRRAVANQVRDRWRHHVVELRHSRTSCDETSPRQRRSPRVALVPSPAGPPASGARAPVLRRPDAGRSFGAARLPARDHEVPGPPGPRAPQEGDGERWLR